MDSENQRITIEISLTPDLYDRLKAKVAASPHSIYKYIENLIDRDLAIASPVDRLEACLALPSRSWIAKLEYNDTDGGVHPE